MFRGEIVALPGGEPKLRGGGESLSTGRDRCRKRIRLDVAALETASDSDFSWPPEVGKVSCSFG
jgi:hypothetical protein